MATQKMIAVKEFCKYHNINSDLIVTLNQNELIELITIKRTHYIPGKNLHALEKIVRLYNDLHVNIEGIQTILHLLSQLEEKEAQIAEIRNQLEFYTSR